MVLEQKPQAAVKSSLWYLEESELYRTTKPYHLTFIPDTGLPQTNINAVEAKDISIVDLRTWREPITFDTNGFTLLTLDDNFGNPDYESKAFLEQHYFPSLESSLGKVFPGCKARVLQHRIRKRHEKFPISTGQDYDFGQPARVVHVGLDYTAASAKRNIRSHLGDETPFTLQGRYLYVTVWRPLKGPNQDWPLAVCDAASVDPENDLEAADYVSKDEVTENYLAYFRPHHRWFYVSNQSSNEAIVFRQHDSKQVLPSGIPHAAFYDPSASDKTPRESIEVSLVVYWASKE
ncbi:putative CmcJ-like methyltransferase [Lophiotrema nucula]|uniref:Putative CmcJ-like methyltransferase n=1 Tax=Lophiotrema nucula TaxID=690887 RepID=A0A6A5YH96_9PLEO|nr:putative CmcJ-like methyltransferase [Lophiotrema nucula]